MSFLYRFPGGVLAHAIFDVVVDDEVEFFVGEAVVVGKDAIGLVNDGF